MIPTTPPISPIRVGIYFRNLPGGSYSMTEVIQDGWEPTVPLPRTATLDA